ncbi:hypothetical protein B0T17DRAFT_501331 [Bombardia bombarda]|uniref:Sorting nexin MVP1 n=1 Tax=Bombardia bombarda TaxID=252184 RepID=A0AA39WBE6_9PEZI|nr:hypothetical protein B0T17DRAFT_501331 [Bombardia bombarda]
MSLFGSSPPDDQPRRPAAMGSSNYASNSRSSLFDDESPMTKSGTTALFADEGDDPSRSASPWDLPTPRKQQTRADLLRNLLPSSDVPDSYIHTFDAVVHEDGGNGVRVTAGGIARTLAAAKLGADQQARIMGIIAPGGVGGGSGGSGGDVTLGRNEFNVLLALIGLAQEGELVNLDGVDERRRNLPQPKLPGLIVEHPSAPLPVLPHLGELAAKPPQRPSTPPRAAPSSSPKRQPHSYQQNTIRKRDSMDYPDDPWNTPDVHKNHNHGPEPARPNPANDQALPNQAAFAVNVNGRSNNSNTSVNNNGLYGASPEETTSALPVRTTSTFTTNTVASGTGASATHGGEIVPGSVGNTGAWGYFDGNPPSAVGPGAGFNPQSPLNNPIIPPFGVAGQEAGLGGDSGRQPSGIVAPSRTIGSGVRAGNEGESILVTLLPEKEGMFLFQHHNYEVTSSRRGSKVIRRYSDFVWLLDCLHKRYPFRILPLLPPKRVAVNGNHLSNDGAFIEKRRRGLARFLNALVRHPILGQEQLVIMFLTVPTELSVWRKQATISVQDEFAGRSLPPGLEDSLSPTLEDLFTRTRAGVQRSADLYITVCSVMDRLVKRSEGVAADHARIAMSLTSLTEASEDTYATDTNEVPLLNDGLQAMSKHLRTSQSLMEDEARAWDEGVLEDLKRQRDALVSLRDLFERRERLDKDNIPYLERRIAANETKLASLRAKPEAMVKQGEVERVVEAIIKDKESIVNQHNRSVFVKECLRDELSYFQHTQYNVTRWNQDWAQERVKYSEMLADNWRRLLDDLEGMPLED